MKPSLICQAKSITFSSGPILSPYLVESSMTPWNLTALSHSIPTNYVIIAKLLNLSVLQLPHLEDDKNNSTYCIHM